MLTIFPDGISFRVNNRNTKTMCKIGLTHFRPMFPFHTPWKHQKTKGFKIGNIIGTLVGNGLKLTIKTLSWFYWFFRIQTEYSSTDKLNTALLNLLNCQNSSCSIFKHVLPGLRQYLETESPLQMMKNAFYFTLKVLLVFNIFKLCPDYFGHVGKWLDKKVNNNLNIFDVIKWETINYNKHIAQNLKK